MNYDDTVLRGLIVAVRSMMISGIGGCSRAPDYDAIMDLVSPR